LNYDLDKIKKETEIESSLNPLDDEADEELEEFQKSLDMLKSKINLIEKKENEKENIFKGKGLSDDKVVEEGDIESPKQEKISKPINDSMINSEFDEYENFQGIDSSIDLSTEESRKKHKEFIFGPGNGKSWMETFEEKDIQDFKISKNLSASDNKPIEDDYEEKEIYIPRKLKNLYKYDDEGNIIEGHDGNQLLTSSGSRYRQILICMK
jgi:hypothetical protein